MGRATRLEMRGVTFSYARREAPVLAGLEFALREGRGLGVIGPNGAGKSTLLRLAAGLLAPLEGQVLLRGRPSTEMSPGELGRFIGYVPQSFGLPFEFRVMEVVLQGRHPHLGGRAFERREDLEIAREAMERTGTWQLRDRTFDALSGGERQRVVIAAALAQQPEVLVLDEPTSSLDLRFQAALVRLVRDLTAGGMAVLVALHDLNLASAMCDELLLLVQGRQIALGPPEEVLEKKRLERAYETPLHVSRGPGGIHVLPIV